MRIPRRAQLLGALLIAGGLVIGPPSAVGPGPGVSSARAGTDACDDGWARRVESPNISTYDILSLSKQRAVTVGTQRQFSADRRFITAWWDGASWETSKGPPTGGDTGLMGVGGRRAGRVWAVGFVDTDRAVPLAVQWRDGRWVQRSPPRPSSGAQLLSAVDVDPGGGVWAVGMAVTGKVVRTALVWRRAGGGWQRHTALHAGRGTALTGVVALAADDVWAVGSKTSRGGIRPLVLHWNGSAWTSTVISGVGTDATLGGIAGTGRDDLWAVGWTTGPQGTKPLVLHRTGSGWTSVPPPDLGGAFAVLSDVSVDAQGRPWVVGGSWRDAVDMYVPAAARLGTEGWVRWPRPPGPGRYLSSVSGDLAHGGWASGRSDIGGLRLSACEPVTPTPGTAGRAGHGSVTVPVEDAAGEDGPRPIRGLPAVPPLDAAVAPAGFALRDEAHQAGIDLRTRTYGATWADVDGDGRKDIFVSGHAGPASLYLRVAGGYERQPDGAFRRVDRHDCDVARIDGDALADIVCTGGADRGVGFKSNEIWMDPSTGAFDDQGPARGIADPVGRGREIAVFDADGDRDPDVLLGTMPLRYDAQASPNRLMRNDGTGHFTWARDAGIPRDRGAWCLRPVDFDRDGDTDLLLCAVSGNILESAELIVLRNDGRGHFTDVTRATGVRPIGERDSDLGRFGGSARPDLVQLSVNRIRVSLWRDGRWVPAFERSISRARALAVGDVDGDGSDDLYILRGTESGNDQDLVLLNDGTGRRFTTIAVPRPDGGSAQDVMPLDWDRDGRDDFLVLNGQKGPGPAQLISLRG